MKISVIIPTYNREKHILQAIKSVKEQSVQVDEILVIDDGSDDNTKELLKNEPIRYIYQQNAGVSSARNKGIKEAKNEYIAFLDSDDTWHENKIAQHINYHKKNPQIKASYTKEVWIRNNKIISLKKYQQKEEPSFVNSLALCKIGTSTFFSNILSNTCFSTLLSLFFKISTHNITLSAFISNDNHSSLEAH